VSEPLWDDFNGTLMLRTLSNGVTVMFGEMDFIFLQCRRMVDIVVVKNILIEMISQ